MMETQSWVFRVKAEEGESLGHYLGRFSRANYLSQAAIAQHLGVRLQWVEDWFSPSKRRNPSELQVIALSKLVEVPVVKLKEMFPPSNLHLATRLCGICYGEIPVHRRDWQKAESQKCDRHQVKLLSECPRCQTGFRTPALWSEGCCEKCGLTFKEMGRYQLTVVG
ncbi:MAG: hypothetical protein AB4372_36880 [Xenococcus sp. (in: cyanobacteria)]